MRRRRQHPVGRISGDVRQTDEPDDILHRRCHAESTRRFPAGRWFVSVQLSCVSNRKWHVDSPARRNESVRDYRRRRRRWRRRHRRNDGGRRQARRSRAGRIRLCWHHWHQRWAELYICLRRGRRGQRRKGHGYNIRNANIRVRSEIQWLYGYPKRRRLCA